jgi:hypothetical protein
MPLSVGKSYADHDILFLLDDVVQSCGGLFAMLKGYFDLGEKGDQSDGVMCVACVIFKPARYKQFIRPWNRMLKAWGASAFHATDFYIGAGEFTRGTPARQQLFEEDSKRIPGMIARAVQRVSTVSFRPEEFKQVVSAGWKARFGTSIHSYAVQLSLFANGYWREDRCRLESFAYFMETGDTDQDEVLKTVDRMRSDKKFGIPPIIKVSAFTPLDKGMARGLEAADFVAWHWDKHYMDKMRAGKTKEPRKDFAAFADIAGDKFDYFFLTGDDLQLFLSRMPSEVLDRGRK